MENSPLLANGYNPPPTHLSPMQFMALNHAAQQAAAAAAQHALLGSPNAAAIHQSSLGLGLPSHHAAVPVNYADPAPANTSASPETQRPDADPKAPNVDSAVSAR